MRIRFCPTKFYGKTIARSGHDNYVRFGLTALNDINKSGTLKPDANGYYPVVLGG